MIVLIVLVAAFQVVGTIIYLSLVHRLFSRLATRHPSVWHQLGAPALLVNSTFRNNMLFLRWLWRKEYERLTGAPEDVILAARIRSLLIPLLLSFVLLVALLLWAL